MTPEERAAAMVVVKATLRWARIRQKNLTESQPTIPTDADADHSPLLIRCLKGEKIYDRPPPTAFSYPWYGLVERGWDLAGNPEFDRAPKEYEHWPGKLMFNQSIWEIEERYQANGYPAWKVHHANGWDARVEWEDGPFNLGRSIVPEPHDIMGPAYIIRLT